MYKSIFTLYLLLHLIGDFFLQTDTCSKKKEEEFLYVLLHGLLYTIPFLLASIFMKDPEVWLIQVGILCFAHFVVDYIKYSALKGRRTIGPLPYLVDQSIHLVVLIVMTFVTIERWSSIYAADWVYDVFLILDIDGIHALAWICILFTIWNPTNITIKQMLAKYKPSEEDNSKTKAGAMIGTLERVIMMLLLGMGQYAAIALVLTAKSIARYDMLKDRVFAEYYLLGTLLSTLFVLSGFIFLAP